MKSIYEAGISMLNMERIQKRIRRDRIFCLKSLLATALGVLLLLCSSFGHTAEQKALEPEKTTAPVSAHAPAPIPSGPTAIPVADVATQATEVANLLQGITQRWSPVLN